MSANLCSYWLSSKPVRNDQHNRHQAQFKSNTHQHHHHRDLFTVKSLLTFLTLLPIILIKPGHAASNKLRDIIHRDCHRYQREKLSRDCYGINDGLSSSLLPLSPSPSSSSSASSSSSDQNQRDDCITDGTCTMITVVQVSTRKETEVLNITLYGFELGIAALKNFSFSLGLSDEEAGPMNDFLCTSDRHHKISEALYSLANGTSLKHLGSSAYNGKSGVICSWTLRVNEGWPTSQNGAPMNLILNRVHVHLASGTSNADLKSVELPTYRLQFLRKNCDNMDKICLTGDICRQKCETLLIVTKNRSTQSMLDFKLYVAYHGENEVDQIKVLIGQTGIGSTSSDYDVACGHFVFKESFKFPNSTRIDLVNPIIADKRFIKNSDLDTFRCFWSIPMVFEVAGYKFDLRAAPYYLKLKSRQESVGTVVRFPGFEKERDLYRRCNKPVSSRLSLECFGLDKYDPESDCIQDSSCNMIVTLSTSTTDSDGDRNVPKYSEEYLLLNLYSVGFNEDKDQNLSLIINVDNDNTENIEYICKYRGASRNSTSLKVIHANRRQVREGVKSMDKMVLECSWILEKSRKTWPILKNGTEVNLVLAESISLILRSDGVSKRFSSDRVRLPIFRLRYLYRDCNREKGDKICLGEGDCITRRDCKKLITISKTYKDEDELLVSIYGIDNDRTIVTTLKASGTEQEGLERLKVICSQGQSKVSLVNPNGNRIEWDNSLVTKSDFGSGLRCFWTIPKTFQQKAFDFTSQTAYLTFEFYGTASNMTFSFDNLRLPGYKAPEVTDGSTHSLHWDRSTAYAFTVFLLTFWLGFFA